MQIFCELHSFYISKKYVIYRKNMSIKKICTDTICQTIKYEIYNFTISFSGILASTKFKIHPTALSEHCVDHFRPGS